MISEGVFVQQCMHCPGDILLAIQWKLTGYLASLVQQHIKKTHTLGKGYRGGGGGNALIHTVMFHVGRKVLTVQIILLQLVAIIKFIEEPKSHMETNRTRSHSSHPARLFVSAAMHYCGLTGLW